MFDVGFSELVLLFVIGLLILGPERLPRVAAKLGRWVGHARRTATQLRLQFEREMTMQDIMNQQRKKPQKPDEPPQKDAKEASQDSEAAPAPPADAARGDEPGGSSGGAAQAEPGEKPVEHADETR
jgi:sec-independent protein translocase protein TatB